MNLTIAACFFPLCLLLGCTDSPRQQQNVENKTAIKNKPPGSYSDTIPIRSSAAVFYHPDSLQVEKIKAITDSSVFASTMHEMFYQMRYSRIVIAKYYPTLKVFDIANARFLLFIKENGQKEYIDLNAINDQEGLLIFDGKKSPKLVDMTNVETELDFYFKQ